MLLVRPSRPLMLSDPFGADLLDLTRQSQRVTVCVEQVKGRGVLLGRHVAPARVVALDASDGLWRRMSSGPALFLDDAVYVGIGVPSIDHQFKDATPRNLLNRHVRPMVAALRGYGLQATYLGRDWISVVAGGERRALFAIGYEGLRTGELLFEFHASLASDLRIPASAASDLELATKRFGGRPTVPFCEVGGLEAMVDRLRGHLVEALATATEAEETTIDPVGWTAWAEAAEQGPSKGAPVEVPIGWLDAFEGGRVGGDLLCASWVLDHASRSSDPPENALLDGATWSDVLCAKARSA